MLGRSYLIDHCARYHKSKTDELNYRVSVAEITRGLLGCLTGKYDDIPSYAETVYNDPISREKEPTANEVIDKIRNKLASAGDT